MWRGWQRRIRRARAHRTSANGRATERPTTRVRVHVRSCARVRMVAPSYHYQDPSAVVPAALARRTKVEAGEEEVRVARAGTVGRGWA